MIRDRRFGPILVITLAAAIGCGGASNSGPAGKGGLGGIAGSGGSGGGAAGASGGTAVGGGSGAAGTGGGAGDGGGAAGTGGGAGSGSAAGSNGGSAAGSNGGSAAGSSGGSVAGSSGGSLAGSNGGSAVGSSGGGVAGSGGGSAAGSNGGSAVGSNGGSVAGSNGGSAAGSSAGGGAGSGGIPVPPTPGSYRLTCDGSMAVMIDATHFLDGNDEDQGLRLYARGTSGTPLATIDVSAAIGLSSGDEADFEDAARIGNRIYVIGSHGRNKNGRLERARFHFFAMDLSGTSPDIALSVPGYTTMLLDQMLLEENWIAPNTAVLTKLTASSNLSRATDPALPPLAGGTNIEGLGWMPTASRPNQLLIGFRSPLHDGKALVVSLLNADVVVAGANAQFGEAMLLDLGGLSIRGMAWSTAHAAMLLIGGPLNDAAGPFRLFKWSGAADDAPIAVGDITGVPTTSAPESIVIYPGSRDVQIVFDQGDHTIDGGGICKDAAESVRVFGDLIMHVP